MAVNTVTLVLNGEVPLEQFATAVRGLTDMMTALSKELDSSESIEWIIDDLEAHSAVATIRGETQDEDKLNRIVRAYEVIGESMGRGEPIPYSKAVTAPAMRIASVLNGRISSVVFETASKGTTIESIEQKAPPGERRAYGAVEGRVQTLSSRSGLRFTLYDTLADRAVSCYLGSGQEGMMKDVWGKRAIVEGIVTRDIATGRSRAVRQVSSIKPLPDALVGSYRSARAIAPIPQGGLLPEAFIRALRDAD